MPRGIIAKIGVIIGCALAGLCLQLAIFGPLLPQWLVPNFSIMIAVFLGVFEPTIAGAFLAFSIGLIYDFASGDILGPWCGACVTVFGFLSQVARRMFVDTSVLAALLVFGGALFGFTVYLLLLRQLTIYWSDFSFQLIGCSVASAACSPMLYPIFKRYFKRQTGISRYL